MIGDCEDRSWGGRCVCWRRGFGEGATLACDSDRGYGIRRLTSGEGKEYPGFVGCLGGKNGRFFSDEID